MTEQQLNELEKYAELMFSVREIALILELNPSELQFNITEEGSPQANAFNRGRLKAEAAIRQSIFDLAQNGSSPAQSQYLELIDKAKLDDILL